MVYIAQQSFGFGEVDPNIRAQYESLMYQKGCQTLSNALLSDTGSACKRWGSVFSVDIENGQKAFEFVDGYGSVFIISGRTTGYDILQGSTIIYSSPTETAFSIKDACSTGNELFLLTSAGLFVHQFAKVDPDDGYTIMRSRLNTINSDLITSQPETTMTFTWPTSGVGSFQSKVITSGTSFFEERECGKVKFYNDGSWPPENASYKYIPRTNSEEIWKIASPLNPDTNSIPFFTYLGKRETDATVKTYDYYSYGIRLFDGEDAPYVDADGLRLDLDTLGPGYSGLNQDTTVKIHLNGATSLLFSPSVVDGDVVKLYHNGAGYAKLRTAGGTVVTPSGVQDGRIEFEFIGCSGSEDPGDASFWDDKDTFSTNTDISGHSNGTELDMPTHDWIGPYKNWVNVGKVLTPATSTVAGVIGDANWSILALGNPTLLSTVATGFDDDHHEALDLGAVGRFVLYRHGVRYKTTYFYVSDKELDPYASVGSSSPLYIVAIQGNYLEPVAITDDHFVLVMQLASSDDFGTMADGLAAPRNGVARELLVRGSDTLSGYFGTEQVQRVGMVGCPSTSTTITSYTPVFTGKALTSTTSASIEVRHTAVIGDRNPIVNSQVFRVGKHEIDGGDNLAPPISIISGVTGVGPSAYWKLTGAAINPSPPAVTPPLVPDVLLKMDRIEYHQSRIFIGGFDSDITGSYLRKLPSSQNLGITLVSTHSGSTKNFATGDLDNEGISVQISSKRGGKIVWLKSHMNALFIGTGEEEFVIEDAPMTPASINVSSQSVYGSTAGSHAELFGNNVVFVQKDGRTIRAMGYEERRRRFESTDLLQYAKHITKNEKITRIAIVGTATQYLFILTDAGKVWCLGLNPQNEVFGWSQWKSDDYTYSDILGTNDGSGNPALWARVLLTGATTASKGVYITSDPIYSNRRMDLIEEHTGGDIVNTGILAGVINISDDLLGKEVSYILEVGGVELYYGNATVVTIPGGSISGIYFGGEQYGTVLDPAPTKAYIGLPYTFSLIPNIPELMLPGKGSTSGRNKNISRIRAYFSAARGGVVEGNSILTATAGLSLVPDSPGFYSVSVIGEYGPQPQVNISQAVPYEFEISGFNAEYDFGD